MTTKRLRVLAIALCVLLLGVGILGSLFYALGKEEPRELSFSSEEILPVSSSWKEEAGRLLYTKEYLLGEAEDPKRLSRAAFKEDGILWSFYKEETAPQVTKLEKSYTYPVSFESASNKMEVLLGMLDSQKEVKTEDGYEGTVYLDAASIKATAKGYGSKTVTVRKVREYYNLSSRDLSYVPKSITENGVTYQFRNVSWQAANLEQMDGYLLPNQYTAVATYEGSKTERYATGYTVEALYQGQVEKTEVSGIAYRLLFTGKKEAFGESLAVKISGGVILMLGCMGIGIHGAKRLRKYKEARETLEERW